MIDQEGKDSQMNMHERVRVMVQGFNVDISLSFFQLSLFKACS